MITAFFHDERFARDLSGTYLSTGSVPYACFARYLRCFDRIVVVGRLGQRRSENQSVASGPGVEWACIDEKRGSWARFVAEARRHVRAVIARVDAAVVRIPSLIGALACHEALRRGAPLLVEVVGNAFDSLWTHGSLLGKLSAVPVHLVTRHCVARAAFAIYVTREVLQRSYPPGGAWVSASDVIVAGAQPEVLQRRITRIDSRGKGTPAVLGLVGSYDVDYKGHETALCALALLERSGSPAKLRCIGVGDPARWRARAAQLGVLDRVELSAPLAHGEPVFEWMDALDLCIVPSLTEGMPRVLIEAMSRALPAVGSRRGGIPELLDGSCLHRAGDPRSLARIVARLLEDPEALKAEATRNWRVASEYAAGTIEARRDAFIQQFRSAVARRMRPEPVRVAP